MPPRRGVPFFIHLLFLPLILCSCLTSCADLSTRGEAINRYYDALALLRSVALQAPQMPAPPATSRNDTLLSALVLAKESVDLYPFFTPAHGLAIELSGMLGDQEMTERLRCYALSLFPDNYEFRRAYLFCLGRRTDYNEQTILETAREGLNRDPSSVPFALLYARALVENNPVMLDEINRAVGTVRKHKILPIEAYAGLHVISVRLAQKGFQETGSQILMELADESPAGLRLGIFMAFEENLDTIMEEVFSRLCEMPEPSSAVIIGRIWFYVIASRFEVAEELLGIGSIPEAARASGQPEVLDVLKGYIALGRGRVLQARELFESVLGSHPACLDALEGMTSVCVSDGTVDGTLRMFYEKAIESTEDPAISRMLKNMMLKLFEKETAPARNDQSQATSSPPLK